MARYPARLTQELTPGQEQGGFSLISWWNRSTCEHHSEWEAQSSYRTKDLGGEALELDIGEDERRYRTNP